MSGSKPLQYKYRARPGPRHHAARPHTLSAAGAGAGGSARWVRASEQAGAGAAPLGRARCLPCPAPSSPATSEAECNKSAHGLKMLKPSAAVDIIMPWICGCQCISFMSACPLCTNSSCGGRLSGASAFVSGASAASSSAARRAGEQGVVEDGEGSSGCCTLQQGASLQPRPPAIPVRSMACWQPPSTTTHPPAGPTALPASPHPGLAPAPGPIPPAGCRQRWWPAWTPRRGTTPRSSQGRCGARGAGGRAGR